MADSSVPITAGSGTNIDTQVPTGGDHRQVVVLGDPSTVASVATVTAAGALKVDGSAVTQPISGTVSITDGSGPVTVDGTVTISNPTANPETGLAKDATLTGGTMKTKIVDTGGTNVATVSAAGAVKVDGSAVTQPVSGTVSVGNFPATQNVALPDTSAAISIAANATSSGSVTGLNGASSVTIQLTGTFVATVQVQVTADGTNWLNITGSNSVVNAATGAYMASGNLTAVGAYQADVTGFSGVRVITTAYTSGTVAGTLRVTQGGSILAVEGTPAITQSGTWTVGVTGYPTAAASADGFANPTVTQIGAEQMSYNGATWDRVRSGSYALNVDTSSARTATGTGTAWVNFSGARGLWVWTNVTAVSGTTPTCVFKLQWSPDNGTTWIDWDTTNLQTTSITGVTTALLKVSPNLASAANSTKQDTVPRQVRLAWTIGGTTPSFTFATWFTAAGG